MPRQNSSMDPEAANGRVRPEDLHGLDGFEAELLPTEGHTPEEIARARRNIADWLEFLPGDCVRMMIALGWHFSVQV